jgi:hypothetical protein
MKVYHIFDKINQKIGKLIEYEDGYCRIHYDYNFYLDGSYGLKAKYQKNKNLRLTCTPKNIYTLLKYYMNECEYHKAEIEAKQHLKYLKERLEEKQYQQDLKKFKKLGIIEEST